MIGMSATSLTIQMSRAIALVALAALTGCATSKNAAPMAPKAAAAATPQQQAALLDEVKSLAGTWQMPPHDGQPGKDVVFAVTASGSAVREIMFPGTAMEMTNLYHMDGPTLVMTHYCAMGNQPRMRATAPAKAGEPIELKFDSVTNLAAPDQMYMGGMTLVFVDRDHFEEHWTSYTAGRPDGDHVDAFKLARKK
jgi:hypothetical protein